MRWALLICGEQDSTKEIDQTLLMLTPAIILGLLKIGYSNDTGVRLVHKGMAAVIHEGMQWDPYMAADEEVPSASLTRCAKQPMKHWHASIAKNGAHQFGIDAFLDTVQEDDWLCNLDCDNIVIHEYIEEVVKFITSRPRRFVHVKTGCGHAAGLTGRYVYRAKDWLELRGYLEELLPSGAQDVELSIRFSDMAFQLDWSKKKS